MKYIVLLLFLCGCAPYRVPTSVFIAHEKAEPSPLYSVIPRHRCQIAWYDAGHWLMWGLFGNDDDGLFGEMAEYKAGCPPTLGKALSWGTRNPLHNFTFYVIGSAHRRNSGFTLLQLTPCGISALRYVPQACTVFPSMGSCFYLALHGGKPFVSLRLAYHPRYRFDFYLGWRDRGNFGVKFQPAKQVR